MWEAAVDAGMIKVKKREHIFFKEADIVTVSLREAAENKRILKEEKSEQLNVSPTCSLRQQLSEE
jgi:hypothetical protein